MIVLDASAAIGLLDGGQAGRAVHAALTTAAGIHAPELLPVEVVSVLRRRQLTGLYSPAMAREALDAIGDLGVDMHSHKNLMHAALEMAGSITAYDATYVAVAVLLDAPLLTCDARMARSAERWCDVVLAA